MASYISDSLTSLVSGLGTSRDKSSTVYYDTPRLLDQEAINAYMGSWLSRKIVDQPAKDCFRKWREWQGDTAISGKIEKEEKRLDLRNKLERAMILARLIGRAHVYFDTGEDPAEPVNINRVGLGGLKFATVVSKREVADGEIDDDPISPYYGSPRYYELMSPRYGMVRIHPSRMVTFYGDEDPRDMVFGREGQSVLLAAMGAIKRHDGTVANVSGLVYEARVDVITVPDLAMHLQDPEQSKAFLDRFRLMATMKGNNGVVLLSGSANKDVPGETWDQKNTSFATLPDIIEKAQDEVSAAANMPRALLFGTSAGGLGSTGDLELSSYYDSIATMQTNDIEPSISILDECLIRSALGSRPADLWYQWSSLWQMTDKEKSEIADKLTTAAERLVRMGVNLDIVEGPTISALVEAGTFPGLEQSFADFGSSVDNAAEMAEQEMEAAIEMAAVTEPAKPVMDAQVETPEEQALTALKAYLASD